MELPPKTFLPKAVEIRRALNRLPTAAREQMFLEAEALLDAVTASNG